MLLQADTAYPWQPGRPEQPGHYLVASSKEGWIGEMNRDDAGLLWMDGEYAPPDTLAAIDWHMPLPDPPFQFAQVADCEPIEPAKEWRIGWRCSWGWGPGYYEDTFHGPRALAEDHIISLDQQHGRERIHFLEEVDDASRD